MMRIEAEELHKYIDWHIATYRENGDGKKKIVYAKIISVNLEENHIVLEQMNNVEEGQTTRFEGYYKNKTEVEVYEEDEAVLLALKDF